MQKNEFRGGGSRLVPLVKGVSQDPDSHLSPPEHLASGFYPHSGRKAATPPGIQAVFQGGRKPGRVRAAIRADGLVNMPVESVPFSILPTDFPSYFIGQNWIDMATSSYKDPKKHLF